MRGQSVRPPSSGAEGQPQGRGVRLTPPLHGGEGSDRASRPLRLNFLFRKKCERAIISSLEHNSRGPAGLLPWVRM